MLSSLGLGMCLPRTQDMYLYSDVGTKTLEVIEYPFVFGYADTFEHPVVFRYERLN